MCGAVTLICFKAARQTAAAPQAAPEGPRALDEELAEKTRDAIKALEAAEAVGGGEALKQAWKLLQTPSTAPRALLLVNEVADSADKEVREAVKNTQVQSGLGLDW